ncbi:DUF72 domain-containing protein [Rhizobium sp. 0TCS1.26]|uniref:DUF72 domain-containing protein n=1 Tax=Rhizobium sp. 0TCS1.26 TaxID=3142623 RepID=UPI003D2A299D
MGHADLITAGALSTDRTPGAKIRIGISGWSYAGWRGVFYPPKLRHADELRFAAERFRSIEINGSFYRMQTPQNFGDWQAQTPDTFEFAVKGPKFITHMKGLRDVEVPLANFLASGPLRLGRKLGPMLWQFPARRSFDADLFEAFLALLPKTQREAAELGARHDQRLRAPAFLDVEEDRPIRHAVEIRSDSFRDNRFIALLRRYKVALVVADTVEWPLLADLTSDFVYCRLHGSEELYASGYADDALDRWARLVATWADGDDPEDAPHVTTRLPHRKSGRDVYLYFDNDAKVRAPKDAQSLIAKLSAALPQA